MPPVSGGPAAWVPVSVSPATSSAQLDALRVEIDRIDADMHALLIERSGIIDELIAIKARQGGGSAFRPGREAEMMRRLAERHTGRLPLDTVESIWRVIISTFTFLQAPYAVHADTAGGDAAMRDSARFHFGFTVPLHSHFGAAGVIGAVASASGDLGLLHAENPKAAWWRGLEAPEAPKIIARLPFVERPDHPAGLPVFVIARPGAAAAAADVLYHAAAPDRWSAQAAESLARLGGSVVSHAVEGARAALLFATPGSVTIGELATALGSSVTPVYVGSHAARFELA
jgi:chorismate mutase